MKYLESVEHVVNVRKVDQRFHPPSSCYIFSSSSAEFSAHRLSVFVSQSHYPVGPGLQIQSLVFHSRLLVDKLFFSHSLLHPSKHHNVTESHNITTPINQTGVDFERNTPFSGEWVSYSGKKTTNSWENLSS